MDADRIILARNIIRQVRDRISVHYYHLTKNQQVGAETDLTNALKLIDEQLEGADLRRE